MKLIGGIRCIVKGNPHDGAEVVLIALNDVTKTWRVRLPDGSEAPIRPGRLAPIEGPRAPIQRIFGGFK